MTLADRVLEIKDRCEKATKGPWETQERDDRERGIAVIAVIPEVPKGGTPTRGMVTWVGQGGANFGKPQQQEVNADFIAHAREDIPFLLGELDRLTQERGNLLRSVFEAQAAREDAVERVRSLEAELEKRR